MKTPAEILVFHFDRKPNYFNSAVNFLVFNSVSYSHLFYSDLYENVFLTGSNRVLYLQKTERTHFLFS